jgi:nitric oxide reductase subunit B
MIGLRRNGDFSPGDRALIVMLASALGCVLLSILAGALAALYYVPALSAWMLKGGVSLVQLRPLHTTYASAWIFLGAATCVFKYLFDVFGQPTDAERRRFRIQMVCWGVAGLGALLTLPFGITSGREYLGFHPALSLLIAAGWILFAWTFFSRVRHGFWQRPVYVYMWAVGIVYFLWTFAEGHAWLLPSVRAQPVADLQIQWKSCGTLVAAFNQMVYGSLMYIGERRSGDERIAHSGTAFALFGIGLLNSFTNYAHHTYHLPQAQFIKWVAFGVSMLEIIILVKLFQEITTAMARQRSRGREALDVTGRFFVLSRNWNLFLLTLALAISVPPWNALIHGTHVVMAHAMGSELAIDSYILLGVFAAVLGDIFPKREVSENVIHGARVQRWIGRANTSLVLLVALLLLRGLATASTRYLGRPEPDWVQGFPYLLVILGISFGWYLLRMLHHWLPLFVRPGAHKAWRDDAGSRRPLLGEP